MFDNNYNVFSDISNILSDKKCPVDAKFDDNKDINLKDVHSWLWATVKSENCHRVCVDSNVPETALQAIKDAAGNNIDVFKDLENRGADVVVLNPKTEDECIDNLNKAYSCVRSGGLILVNNYNLPHVKNGVIKAKQRANRFVAPTRNGLLFVLC